MFLTEKELDELLKRDFGPYLKGDLIDDLPLEYSDTLFHNGEYVKHDYNAFLLRERLISIIGYSVATHKFCCALADYLKGAKCLEIMAGTGCLTYGLRLYGTDVIATDDLSWGIHGEWIYDMEQLDCIAAIRKYGADIDYLIVSWPPMDNQMVEVVNALSEVNSKAKIIYIGEGAGGCTGCDKFWDKVELVSDNNWNKVYQAYRSWYGIHDKPYLLKISK